MAEHKNEAGQALVVVAFAMVVILGFLGLGFDLGYLRYTKQRLQIAADAAALAGAVESSQCAGTSDCSALTAAAQDALTENGFTGSVLLTACSTSGATLTVAVNNPPCYLGANDPHHGDAAVVAQKTPVFFSRILGYNSVLVTARGEAGVGSSSNCLYALSPLDANALTLSGGSSMTLPACSVYVDSSSSLAVTTGGGARISAASISIVGGYSIGGGSTISPTPTTGASAVGDPLAYVPEPSYTPCASPTAATVLNHSATPWVLMPGNYCGGIQIGSDANVTFNPGSYVVGGGISIGGAAVVTFGAGMYVMQGGGFVVGGGASVTGSGVTFFLTGTSGNALFKYGPVSLSGGAVVTLTAPTSGTYVGMLFDQDPSAYGATSATASSFTAGSASYFQGSLYFPTTSVTYSGGASAQYTILVAADISISGGATLNSDYSSLQGGSPIKGSGAVLVE